MTTQSGITASAGLLSCWADAVGDSATRLLRLTLESESIVISHALEAQGSFKDDFALIEVDDSTPAYILYRLEPTPASQWVFYSYVPDAAPVRSKMLYASTRATLSRSLGDSRIATAIFATSKADLTHAAYLSHLTHLSSDAPLTARESEMAEIRAAELAAGADASNANAGRPAWSGAVGLAWTEEAKAVLEGFAQGSALGDVVRLEVDTKKEEVVASDPQPTALELPPSTPSYTFLRHASGVVFIYSCPPSSPIKSRLLYSSSAGGVVQNAKSLGVDVAKKIETSSPEEVDAAFVDAEVGPVAGAETSSGSAPMPTSDGKSFAKPSRPGRKR
ncbi:hypothetical protein RQP46_006429 [Phenoliferia psychrophenolica]